MGLESTISWCDATWNPWQGCTRVSPECTNCYMYRDKARYGQDPATVVRSAPATFNLPLARYGARSTKGAGWKIPAGSRVFCCSWSDWFHPDADAWRPEAWEIIRQRPDLTFLVLTKRRADLIVAHLPPDWGDGWPNVWLGVTVGTQRSTWRLDALAHVPARGRFVSAEPLLERIDFGPNLVAMDWLLIGGESGPNARVMAPSWARYARDQARAAGLAVHFKQWGPRGVPPLLDGESLAEFPTPRVAVACRSGVPQVEVVTTDARPGTARGKRRLDAAKADWPERARARAAAAEAVMHPAARDYGSPPTTNTDEEEPTP